MVAVKLPDVFMSFRGIIVSLILVKSQIELHIMLDNTAIQR